MVTIARFGMFAIAAVAAVAVALPRMLATGNAAPVTHVAVPAVPLFAASPRHRRAPRTSAASRRLARCRRRAHCAREAAAGASALERLEIDHLPKLAPYSLPPRLKLRARAHAPAGRHLLERRVLHSSHLALSPAAKRAVSHHLVAPGALALLLHTPHLGSPLLVFSAAGARVEVQATRMWMTRSTLIALGQAFRRRPARLAAAAARHELVDRCARPPWRHARPAGGRDRKALPGHPVRLGRLHADGRLRLLRTGDVRLQASSASRLDHYAAWQFLEGTRIAEQDLQPGDLVFFEPKADGPGHVGMYVGDGKMINAPHTGDVVRIVSIQGRAGYVGAVRPY